jgi:FkbM family methyltransferase
MDRVQLAISDILAGQELVLADVGAAYGLPAHLRVLESNATVVMFEPDEERARELEKWYATQKRAKHAKVFQTALAESESLRTLYVTNVPTGSSLLKPGSELALELGDPDYFYPIREATVRTRAVGQVFAEAQLSRLDLIKLDVQGAELAVLRGLGEDLDRCLLGVELEIGFPGAYLEQPGFGPADEYLRGLGLSLFDLPPVRLHRAVEGERAHYPERVFGVNADSTSLSKRICEADALYLRNPAAMIRLGDGQALRRILVLYCTYGFFAEACYLTSLAGEEGLLTPDEVKRVSASIRDWHGQAHYRFIESVAWKRFTAGLQRLARRVAGRLYAPKAVRWARR